MISIANQIKSLLKEKQFELALTLTRSDSKNDDRVSRYRFEIENFVKSIFLNLESVEMPF